MREIYVSRAGDPVHAEDKTITRETFVQSAKGEGLQVCLFLDSRCRCQIFYYNLIIPYTWLELFKFCCEYFIKPINSP